MASIKSLLIGILLDLGLKCCVLPTQRLMALPSHGGDESHHDNARRCSSSPVAFQPQQQADGPGEYHAAARQYKDRGERSSTSSRVTTSGARCSRSTTSSTIISAR